MRRLAVALCALAFLWGCAATSYLMLASTSSGMATAATLASGDAPERLPPPLASADGVWMAGLLIGVTFVAGMPLGIALAGPSALRATAWTAGLLLLGFCIVSGPSVGLLYLPSSLLLVTVGLALRLGPSTPTLEDRAAFTETEELP